MNVIQKIETWGDHHQSKWLAFFRVVLGAVIFFKGLYFVQNIEAINAMLANSAVSIYSVFFAHCVALAHLVGGVLIAIGLITRTAVVFQIPILLGAIIFVHSGHGFFYNQAELGLSIVVLAMLIFFFVFGSGRFSVDEFMRTHQHT
jgi:putative oxidoreductase